MNDSYKLPPAILLMGPTASGKTDLAIYLHDHLPVELISVDSALIYRGMDIGTAKPTVEELSKAPHRLIDICDPAESYSAARFRKDALAAMHEISKRGKIPLLVGGTMLYYRALQNGLSTLPESQPEIRQRLEAEMNEQGLGVMHQRLKQIDPKAAQRINENDPQRTLRALEVWEISGKPLSELQKVQGEPMPYQAIKLVRSPQERSQLHERIGLRFERMLQQGFEQEVAGLMERGDLHLDLPSMRCVGYRQMWEYLQGDSTWDEMVDKGKAATRQLAKRQITWLRSEKDCHWLSKENSDVFVDGLRYIENALAR